MNHNTLTRHRQRVTLESENSMVATHNLYSSPPGVTQMESWPAIKILEEDIKWDELASDYSHDCVHRKITRLDGRQAVPLFVHDTWDNTWATEHVVPSGIFLAENSNVFGPKEVHLAAFDRKVDTVMLANASDMFREFKFRPQLGKEVSLPVFLVEIKDLRRSYKNIRRFIKRLKRLHLDRNKFRTIADLVAAGILEVSFGVGAFFRDVAVLWSIFCRFNQQYDKFILGMGKPISQHRSIIAPDLDDTISIGQTSYRGATMHRRYVRQSESNIPLTLCVRYRYWSCALTRTFGKARALAGALGIQVDPSIPWNLIPFSFLIDWVYPVGTFFEKMAIPAFDMNVTIDSLTISSKTVTNYSLDAGLMAGNTIGEPVPFWTRVANDQVRSYRRFKFRKDEMPDKLEFGTVTLRKVLIGSALVWAILIRGSGGRQNPVR